MKLTMFLLGLFVIMYLITAIMVTIQKIRIRRAKPAGAGTTGTGAAGQNAAGRGTSSVLNPGFQGLSEITYAFASVANNNGSAFAGLAANTPWYDTALGLAMLVGRFLMIIPLLVAMQMFADREQAR